MAEKEASKIACEISEMKKHQTFLLLILMSVTCSSRSKKTWNSIIAVLDNNSDPTGINFPIPGNDDARRSINLYCEL